MPEQSRTRSSRPVVGAVGPRSAPASEPTLVRTWVIERLMRLSLIGVIGALSIAAFFAVFWRTPTAAQGQGPRSPLELIGVIRPPSPTPAPTRTPSPTSTPLPPEKRVAILSGHWSGDKPPDGVVPDTGAVCPDGLKEVDINRQVSERVANLMTRSGWRVDLLKEYDPKLKADQPDYAPTVFLAIHSDSCVSGPDYPFATGYKIAHAEPSDNPNEDDRLVACLREDYDARVKRYNLNFNQNTITANMTEYHAFHQIVRTTPAAIIELGFIGNDRGILTGHQSELAQGIADGLLAFLSGDSCGLPTPVPQITPASQR